MAFRGQCTAALMINYGPMRAVLQSRVQRDTTTKRGPLFG